MQQPSPHTAVLLFLRDERGEARLKSLDLRLNGLAHLHLLRTLNRHSQQVARRSGLPVFVVKGEQQIGNTFGERLGNAIETVFTAGFENVIAIGNDCLSLTSNQLKHIANLLEQGASLVLGPAEDGGVYAIGIQKRAYQQTAFIHLPWQTALVYNALLEYAQIFHLPATCLATEQDIDDAASFQRVFNALGRATRLYNVLKSIVTHYISSFKETVFFISNSILFTTHLRAPPVF
jgi:glycosyltransferase A (GT-A) superfamily protein (DUF2064 family)